MFAMRRGAGSLAVAALAAAVFFCPQNRGWAQEAAHASKPQHTAPIYDLFRTDTTHFSAPPPTVAPWGYKCDADANMYVTYGSSLAILNEPGAIGELPISKISVSSKEVHEYPVPRVAGYQRLGLLSFDVTPGGSVYALLATGRKDSAGKMRPVFLIVKYNDDGTVDSYFKVGKMLGKRIQPLRMTVFADGDFLLSGTTYLTRAQIEEGVPLSTFAGIFDRQGTFIAPLKLGHATIGPAKSGPAETGKSERSKAPKATVKNGNAKQWPQGVTDKGNPVGLESSTLSFSSQDGNVYVLQGTSLATLYVVSPTGEVLRRYVLKPPEPGLSPLQMAPAGVGYLFIYYGRVNVSVTKEHPAKPDYITVLNAGTGKMTSVYRLDGKRIGRELPACADSPDDFLFLGTSKHNHLEVTRYAAQ